MWRSTGFILLAVLVILVMTMSVNAGPLAPQLGPQWTFMTCQANIVIFGGAPFGGKTYGLLLDPIRFLGNPEFGAVILRRETTQIRMEGGLWDTSQSIYRRISGKAREVNLDWTFPSGARITFAHLESEQDRYKYDGAQIGYLGFDQLESFTRNQFFYLMSRNRSVSGSESCIRATCNPVPRQNRVGGWLRDFISWWIDEKTGYAIPERSGVIRWFANINDKEEWADTKEELIAKFGEMCRPLSVTFILSTPQDNVIGNESDPGYLSRLQNLRRTERERLLGQGQGERGGNWNVHDHPGTFFQRSYFQVVNTPPRCVEVVRYWDRAATAADQAKKGSSHTAGVKLGKTADDEYILYHVERFQGSPLTVKSSIKNTASSDGKAVAVGIEQDPGQAGKAEAEDQVRGLIALGYTAYTNTVRESKGKRAEPVSAAAEAHLIKIVDGPWVDDFLNEAENYDGTDACLSDQIDALSGAFLRLTNPNEFCIW